MRMTSIQKMMSGAYKRGFKMDRSNTEEMTAKIRRPNQHPHQYRIRRSGRTLKFIMEQERENDKITVIEAHNLKSFFYKVDNFTKNLIFV